MLCANDFFYLAHTKCYQAHAIQFPKCLDFAPFAVMNIWPRVAFLISGLDKFLKSPGHQNCLEMGRWEGIMAITLFLSHLLELSQTMYLEIQI